MHLAFTPFFNEGRGVYFEDYKGECARDSPTVIFCHSLLMDSSMFWKQVIRFKSEYRVIVWDQRGHGKTPAFKPFTFWDSADDLIHMMDSVGVQTAAVAGISMGGYIAMRAAIKYPHRISGIVVMSSSSEAETKVETWEALKKVWITEGPTAETISKVSLMLFNQTHVHLKEDWEHKWRSMKREHLSHAFSAIQNRDSIKDQIWKIQAPTLIISAEKDSEYSEIHARELCKLIPQSFGVTISEAPHSVVLTHPEEINEHLETFFEAIFE